MNSTGPVTESGKAKSSRNALTLGLYTRQDYVRPDERDLYKEFCETMIVELEPAGLLQQTLAEEIVSASWRLRRCRQAEALLGDFDQATDKPRRSIERARAAAHSLLHRNINQLRKLRAERSVAASKESASICHTGSASTLIATKSASKTITQSQQTPRNAPCPCRSGEKFKRCCGRVGAGWPTEPAGKAA